jgi:hypothetical protein
MWDFLDAILDVGLWLGHWRVYISITAGVVVGLAVNWTFAESTAYIPLMCGTVGAVGGFVWHRRSAEH